MRKLLPGIPYEKWRLQQHILPHWPAEDFSAVHSYWISAGRTADYYQRRHEVTGLIFWCWRFWRHGQHQRWLAEPKLALHTCHGLPGPASASERSLFTVREWLWQWWVVKESHKHAVDSRQHKSPLAHCMDVSTIPFHFSSACPNISRDEYTLANFKSNTGRQINVHQSCFSQLAAIHGKCVLVLLRWVTYG